MNRDEAIAYVNDKYDPVIKSKEESIEQIVKQADDLRFDIMNLRNEKDAKLSLVTEYFDALEKKPIIDELCSKNIEELLS